MKKRNLKSLKLNKKSISSLNSKHLHFIIGGKTQVGDGGNCTFGSDECDDPVNPSEPISQEDQCTVQTLGLSYCQGYQAVPPTCLSYNPCA